MLKKYLHCITVYLIEISMQMDSQVFCTRFINVIYLVNIKPVFNKRNVKISSMFDRKKEHTHFLYTTHLHKHFNCFIPFNVLSIIPINSWSSRKLYSILAYVLPTSVQFFFDITRSNCTTESCVQSYYHLNTYNRSSGGSFSITIGCPVQGSRINITILFPPDTLFLTNLLLVGTMVQSRAFNRKHQRTLPHHPK